MILGKGHVLQDMLLDTPLIETQPKSILGVSVCTLRAGAMAWPMPNIEWSLASWLKKTH